MSSLDSLFNCIILLLSHRAIFAVPTKVDDTIVSTVDSTIVNENVPCATKCPCVQESPYSHSSARTVIMQGMVCSCNLGMRGIPVRDDYRHTPGIGSHKLHTRATVWNDARKICNDEGGHLAIVNSFAEAHILMDIFNRSGPVWGAKIPDEAFIGIHDMYMEGDWVTVLGDSLAKTGYADWSDKWGGQPDNGGGLQNCGGFLREGGIDDIVCDIPAAFFCEIPEIRVL